MFWGFTGYLGKVWAARGLEKQRQEYARLNLELTHQLDLISRRTQVELDTLGHLHKLRTESEFEKMRELWKHIALVRDAFKELPISAHYVLRTVPQDPEGYKAYCIKTSLDFVTRSKEAMQFLREEALSIPKSVADFAAWPLGTAQSEAIMAQIYPDPFTSEVLTRLSERDLDAGLDKCFKRRQDNLKIFCQEAEYLEIQMRKLLLG